MKKLILLISIMAITPVWAQSEWTPQKPVEQQQEESARAEREAKKAAKQARRDAKKAKKEAKRAEKAKRKERKGQSTPAANPQQTEKAEVTVRPAPDTPKPNAKANNGKDSRYLRPGSVPTDREGKVVFTLNFSPRGHSAGDIYGKLHGYLDNLARDEHQNTRIGIVMVNEGEHKIVARYNEWLCFASNFLTLDRSEFTYIVVADCADESLHLTIERITYDYEADRKGGFSLPAREVITDQKAVNKKHTKLLPNYGKFRRKTIDRVDELFGQIRNLFKE